MNFANINNLQAIINAEIDYYTCRNPAKNRFLNNDTVLHIIGDRGVGKTALAMDLCRKRKTALYFPFKHIDSKLAPKIFAANYPHVFGDLPCLDWVSFFGRLGEYAKNCRSIIIFDDLNDSKNRNEFYIALHEFLSSGHKKRTFVVLISRHNLKLPMQSEILKLDRLTIAQLCKYFPDLKNEDMLRLYTISGGLPEIINLYDVSKSYEHNMRVFLQSDSPFYKVAPDYLSEIFRTPESYSILLYAMATGHNRISEIAAFSGFANNKCDKYIKSMDDERLISNSQIPDENGRLRTNYYIKCSYLNFWYLFLFPIRAKLSNGISDDDFQKLLKDIDNTVVKEAYRLACFRWIKRNNFHYMFQKKRTYAADVSLGKNSKYHFDIIMDDDGKMMFVKILDGIHQRCDKNKLIKIMYSVEKTHPLFDDTIYVFSTHRFSDYCVHKASEIEQLNLITIERLKY